MMMMMMVVAVASHDGNQTGNRHNIWLVDEHSVVRSQGRHRITDSNPSDGLVILITDCQP